MTDPNERYAHLCFVFDPTESPPRLNRVGVFSAGPGGLTSGTSTQFAEIMKFRGPDYGSAHSKLLLWCAEWKKWVLPLLNERDRCVALGLLPNGDHLEEHD